MSDERMSPGWPIVARKEFTDHLYSGRFVALLAVLSLAGAGAVFAASTGIRSIAPQTVGIPALFLRLFTVTADPVPFALVVFIAFLGPLLGIMFGFDAISGERNQRTLPRLVAQPIHRDDVINGKFVGGLGIVTVVFVALTLFVAGIGIFRLGVVPTPAELARLSVWVLAAIVYVGFWLALAMLFSVVVRRSSTSAIVGVSIWLGLALFGNLIARLAARLLAPSGPGSALAEARLETILARISPITLFSEASSALLDPTVRTTGVVTLAQLDRAVISNLSLAQSLLVVWPQLVTLVAYTVICFGLAYWAFMRQEVRA